MVTMRIRTEYMKKFKDPKWESYSKCYEELFRYRMARRLLEHSHNPWFWSGSDTDSDVSESPTQSNKKPTETVTAGDRPDAEEYEQCREDGRVRQGRHRVTLPGSTETVPKIQLPEEVEDASHTTSAANGNYKRQSTSVTYKTVLCLANVMFVKGKKSCMPHFPMMSPTTRQYRLLSPSPTPFYPLFSQGGQREGVAELRPQVEEESEEQRANSRCSNQPPTLAKQPDQGIQMLNDLPHLALMYSSKAKSETVSVYMDAAPWTRIKGP